MFNLIMLN